MRDQNEYLRKLREDRIAWGLCTQCGKKNDMKTGNTCLACRCKMNDYMAEHRKPRTEAQKIADKETHRKRTEFRLANGLCVYCGKPKGNTKLHNCVWCQKMINANQRERRRERFAQGLCTQCSKPMGDDTHKLCAACREYSSEYQREKRQRLKGERT